MTRLGDYATKYQTIRMERRDGIHQMRGRYFLLTGQVLDAAKALELGLVKAEPAYIFAAVNVISRVMNDAKLTMLYVPLLGSGHGDLPGEVALLCLALALVTTPDIRHANIVVFGRDAVAEPDVGPQVVRNILAHVAR